MFNIENFDIKLETKTIGRNFIYSDDISSTNTFLLDNSAKFEHGTVILSEQQNEGRGRLNRPWYSNKGQNLTFSILFNQGLGGINPNHLSLAASLSLSSAIENLYQLKSELKWPNDVLINHKKVGGILLESSSKGSELEKIVIGIGVNVNQTKFNGDFKIQPTSVKYELKREIIREKLLSEILNVLEDHIFSLKKNSKKVLDEWREKCRMIGEPVQLDLGKEKKYGIFYDLDANGCLILKTGDKI
jgi:BirA family biotin operon repressor/biotin-[acetyl-CoA-carboxylase] ligase